MTCFVCILALWTQWKMPYIKGEMFSHEHHIVQLNVWLLVQPGGHIITDARKDVHLFNVLCVTYLFIGKYIYFEHCKDLPVIFDC